MASNAVAKKSASSGSKADTEVVSRDDASSSVAAPLAATGGGVDDADQELAVVTESHIFGDGSACSAEDEEKVTASAVLETETAATQIVEDCQCLLL